MATTTLSTLTSCRTITNKDLSLPPLECVHDCQISPGASSNTFVACPARAMDNSMEFRPPPARPRRQEPPKEPPAALRRGAVPAARGALPADEPPGRPRGRRRRRDRRPPRRPRGSPVRGPAPRPLGAEKGRTEGGDVGGGADECAGRTGRAAAKGGRSRDDARSERGAWF